VKTAPVVFGIDVIVPQIMEIGLRRAPNEACGIVVPDLDVPAADWVHELQNRSSDPLTSYEIDTATIKQLVDDPDAWADVLVWHTHPKGGVGPSKGDMESKVQGLRYLVVALPRGEAVLF
jgi:proteasome lid subunit RPN8/RPN11